MQMNDIAFGIIDWGEVERTEHPGETGKAFWRTRTFNVSARWAASREPAFASAAVMAAQARSSVTISVGINS